jgi:hypothetical protein
VAEQLFNSLISPSGAPDMALNGSITDIATTITVDALPANISGPNFRIKIAAGGVDTNDEILLVTDISSAPVLTVTREAENASQLPKCAHSDGAKIYVEPTAAGLIQWLTDRLGANALAALVTELKASADFWLTGIISPTQLTANTDDYAPTDGATNSVWRLSTDAPRNLTGISIGQADGRILVLVNAGSFTLTLKHNTTSTAANRFLLPNSTDLAMAPNDSVILVSDGTSSRWRVAAQADPDYTQLTNVPVSFTPAAHAASHNHGGADAVAEDAAAATPSLRSLGTGSTQAAAGNDVGLRNFIHLRDQETAGTDGGTLTAGAWRTCTLNTIAADTGSDCSLSSNQFTPAAGTYRIEAHKAVFGALAYLRTRIQNVTDGATVLESNNGSYGEGGAGARECVLMGRFTIAVGKALELQIQSSATISTNGMGISTNGTFTVGHEIYADVFLWREA